MIFNDIKSDWKNLLIIIALVWGSTLLLYLPFLLRLTNVFGLLIPESNLHYIYRNYDGLLYIIAAKSWYLPSAIKSLHLELSLQPQYFAAHLPLYPFFIKVFSFIGYMQSMLFVNVMFSTLLALLFYYIIKKFYFTNHPLLLTIVFLFLPRFLVVRSIGAPESLFMFLVLLSIIFFEKGKYVLAGIFGGLAVMTKTPGMLLFIAYSFVFLEQIIKTKQIPWKGWGIVFIPIGLLAVFFIYGMQYHDFFAYFHSGDNIHLVFPYSVFNFQKTWVGTAWLEEIIFYFFLYGFTVVTLWKSKYRSMFYFSLIFLTATIFVQHRDISRYSLPIWPIACIALSQFFTSKKFLLVFIILLPAIYLYALNFVVFNTMPVSNWAPYL